MFLLDIIALYMRNEETLRDKPTVQLKKSPHCRHESGLITEDLQVEIERAFEEVLSFDSLRPIDIRRVVAVPRVRRSGRVLAHLSLGLVSESFPEYIRQLKETPLSLPPVSGSENFELAVFLLVLKRHKPLNEARDFFIQDFDSWHQRIQGISIRAELSRIIQLIRDEQKTDFYEDANSMEQLVELTDYIHEYCLARPPLSLVPREKMERSGEKSWLDIHDGKSIGYAHRVLREQHGQEVS